MIGDRIVYLWELTVEKNDCSQSQQVTRRFQKLLYLISALGIYPVGINNNFFELGRHFLLAIQIIMLGFIPLPNLQIGDRVNKALTQSLLLGQLAEATVHWFRLFWKTQRGNNSHRL